MGAGVRASWAWSNFPRQSRRELTVTGESQQVPHRHAHRLFRATMSHAGTWRSPCWRLARVGLPRKRMEGCCQPGITSWLVICFLWCSLQNLRQSPLRIVITVSISPFPPVAGTSLSRITFPRLFSVFINLNGYMLLLVEVGKALPRLGRVL